MKKIITITFILLIGIIFLSGCSSNDVKNSNEQQNINGEPQQNQQQRPSSNNTNDNHDPDVVRERLRKKLNNKQ